MARELQMFKQNKKYTLYTDYPNKVLYKYLITECEQIKKNNVT